MNVLPSALLDRDANNCGLFDHQMIELESRTYWAWHKTTAGMKLARFEPKFEIDLFDLDKGKIGLDGLRFYLHQNETVVKNTMPHDIDYTVVINDQRCETVDSATYARNLLTSKACVKWAVSRRYNVWTGCDRGEHNAETQIFFTISKILYPNQVKGCSVIYNNTLAVEIHCKLDGEVLEKSVLINIKCGEADIAAMINESKYIPFLGGW